MNREDPFEINRSTAEYPCWEAAHWIREADIARFHFMKLDSTGEVVTKHESAIRLVEIKTTDAEKSLRRLLAHPDLVADARRLVEAALEAQLTGKRPPLNFWI